MRRHAVEICTRLLGPEDPQVAKLLGDPAVVEVKRKQNTEAAALITRALDILQTNRMTDIPIAAGMYNSLGVMEFGEGDCEKPRSFPASGDDL